MTVMIYEKGFKEHPCGFQGYRVTVKIGGREHTASYSFTNYSKEEARNLAFKYDYDLRKQSENRQTVGRLFDKRTKTQIARGLFCYLCYRNRPTKSDPDNYSISAYFCVTNGVGNRKDFSIKKQGYLGAYRLSVDHFMKVKNIPTRYKQHLLDLMPDPEIFTDYLFQRCKESHPYIDLERLNIDRVTMSYEKKAAMSNGFMNSPTGAD